MSRNNAKQKENRKNREERLDRRAYEGEFTDLTPLNAVNCMRQSELARVCFGEEILYK